MVSIAIAYGGFMLLGCNSFGTKDQIPYKTVLEDCGISVRALQLTAKQARQVSKIQLGIQVDGQTMPRWYDIEPLAGDQIVIIAFQEHQNSMILSLNTYPLNDSSRSGNQPGISAVKISVPLIKDKQVSLTSRIDLSFTLGAPQWLFVSGIPPFSTPPGGDGNKTAFYFNLIAK